MANNLLLRDLLPRAVSAAESRGDPEVRVLPQELALVRDAVEGRRREFVTTRACAHRALAGLGVTGPQRPILRGPHREPLWPDGIVGSLTHCRGFRGAAVAHRQSVRSIGIDAEPAEPLPGHLLATVARVGERRRMGALLGACPGLPWGRLLFSAKEAVYKAWHPMTSGWLDFHDVDVEFTDDGAFSWSLPTIDPGGGERGGGRWSVRDGLVVTTVVVPTDGATDSR